MSDEPPGGPGRKAARPMLWITAALVLVVLFFYLWAQQAEAPRGPKIFTLYLGDGSSDADPVVFQAFEGDNVTFRIFADETSEFHLHGYDLVIQASPRLPGEASFGANLVGRFELEDEGAGRVVAWLEVRPR